MTISMYTASVPVFVRMLNNLIGILEKAEAYAAAQGLASCDLLRRRLQTDMFDLGRQVQIAASGAQGAAARLAGVDLPCEDAVEFAVFNRGREADFEAEAASVSELIERIRAVIAFVGELPPAAIDGAAERPIAVVMNGQARIFTGRPFLLNYVLPNLYFHIGMVYAILRCAGVELGKQDYEGAPVYRIGAVEQTVGRALA